MNGEEKEPTASVIRVVCDGCGRLYEIEGSYDPKTYNLRLYYARCPHCGHERNETMVEDGYFRCTRCRVIYKRRKYWNPAKGQCMCCYMRAYRAKKKA